MLLKKESLTGKRWLKRVQKEDNRYLKANTLGLSEILITILANRGISLNEATSFLSPKIKNQMREPYEVQDMKKVCEIIYKAILNKDRIYLLGDYDVDGLTSTTILYKVLKVLKADVNYYIPDRYKEGYGISKKALKNICKDKPNLLILLDNGSSSIEEVLLARESGLDVIIVDHHTMNLEIPKANAIINPKRIDDNSNLEDLCTVGLTFLLLVALNRFLGEKGYFKDITKPDLVKYLDLVALGTVCDMVPLRGLNRAYAFQGLKMMQKRDNVALKALADNLKINKPLDFDSLGYVFGPCINAGSRMGDSNLPLNLLLIEDEFIAYELANKLIELNEKRKKEEIKIINAAIFEIEKEDITNKEFIFQGSNNWMAGVVGIIASKVKDNYNKPAIIYSIEGDIATASGRSIESIDLGNIIIGAKQKGLLIKGGGHSQAVGFSFNIANISKIEEFISLQIKKIKKNQLDTRGVVLVDDIIFLNAINQNLVQDIQRLEPFGISFPEPLFMLSGVKIINVRQIGKEKNHIMCDITNESSFKIRSFCYKCIPGVLGENLINNTNNIVDLLVKLKLSFYQGKYYINCNIEDISLIDKK